MGQEISQQEIPSGPWDEDLRLYPGTDEDIEKTPEKYKFVFSGYKCNLCRNYEWAWCGYVQTPDTHPFHNQKYQDITDKFTLKTGELTYGNNGVFGFDCSHIFHDLTPGGEYYKNQDEKLARFITLPLNPYNISPTYKDWKFAKDELENLAKQFAEFENKQSECFIETFVNQ